MKDAVFALGFSTLLAHELDAVARAEWRVLPLLSALPDEPGFLVFVLAHVPLVAGLVWLVSHDDRRLRRRGRTGVAAFLVIHAGLHLAFSGHEAYDFHEPLSQSLVFGGALLGLAHLALESRERRRRRFSVPTARGAGQTETGTDLFIGRRK